MTRAVLSALRFRIAEAFSYHMMFWSLPILYLFFLFDGKLFRQKWLNAICLILIGVGFVINWIISIYL
ncbi:MAG: DUF2752 domain-containing protein [Clostridia bacterium]|nr:DUF2752 domain-containing protein [Clostridia bacterium]